MNGYNDLEYILNDLKDMERALLRTKEKIAHLEDWKVKIEFNIAKYHYENKDEKEL